MVNKERILAGRKAIEAFRKAHSQLHSYPWHKGVADEHTQILNSLLVTLKELGFNSLEEFQALEKPYVGDILVSEFELTAKPQQVRFLDLSKFSLAHNLATKEVMRNLVEQGISPNTLLFPHSNKEQKVCLVLMANADINTSINAEEADRLGIPYLRDVYPGGAVYFTSEKNPAPLLFSGNIYGLDAGVELWFRIMERVWEIFGIQTLRSTTNDLLVNGKKITGVGGVLPVVGSANNLDLDIDLMEKVTFFAPNRAPRDRLTSARECLGREVSFGEFQEKLFQAMHEILHVDFVFGELTVAEADAIEALMPKYLSKSWTIEKAYSGR